MASTTFTSGSVSCRRRTFPCRSRIARYWVSPSIWSMCITTSRMKSSLAAQRIRRWLRFRLRSLRSSRALPAAHLTFSRSPLRGSPRWASASRFDRRCDAGPVEARWRRCRNVILARNHSRGHTATMAQETETRHGLDAIAGVAREASRKGPPPVHLLNPPFCGDLDMRIASDGTWFYLKTPIGRPALVKLFASVLKREGDRYFLVTPVEKCGITVEDAPFLAIAMQVEGRSPGQVLRFVTNVGDEVPCGPEHPLRFESETGTGGLKPYLLVRRNLWAKVTRALFYDLVELGEERCVGGVRLYGVVSQGEFFAMAPVDNFM